MDEPLFPWVAMPLLPIVSRHPAGSVGDGAPYPDIRAYDRGATYPDVRARYREAPYPDGGACDDRAYPGNRGAADRGACYTADKRAPYTLARGGRR